MRLLVRPSAQAELIQAAQLSKQEDEASVTAANMTCTACVLIPDHSTKGERYVDKLEACCAAVWWVFCVVAALAREQMWFAGAMVHACSSKVPILVPLVCVLKCHLVEAVVRAIIGSV